MPTDRPLDSDLQAAKSASPGGGQPDPLASLHKMSRTGGLGTQDYIAVNTMAVLSLVLGLASVFAILGTILLVVPAAAVVVAIVAWRQIGRSGGTETGRGIALLGALAALACVAAVGGRELLRQQQLRSEQVRISALIEQLGKDLNQPNYDAAWDLFSPRFQERVKKADFVSALTRIQLSPLYGQIRQMRSNGIVDVENDTARGVILVQVAHHEDEQDRREALFRKSPDGNWQFDDLEGYFPSKTNEPLMPDGAPPGAAPPGASVGPR